MADGLAHCAEKVGDTHHNQLYISTLIKSFILTRNIIQTLCKVLVRGRTGSLVPWVECSPMVWETCVQYQIASYQRLLKWYLIPPCLTPSNIREGSRVKWSNPGKRVASSPTPRYRNYWKGNLLVALYCGWQEPTT